MFTKLLAYEIRSRYRADARSFGAFIAVIAIAAGIVAQKMTFPEIGRLIVK